MVRISKRLTAFSLAVCLQPARPSMKPQVPLCLSVGGIPPQISSVPVYSAISDKIVYLIDIRPLIDLAQKAESLVRHSQTACPSLMGGFGELSGIVY